MRFAYIDSQGNEVEIPSEDALRLRIELGAIVESTSFFDEQAGGWAAARDHEVYRRLRRDLEGAADPGPVSVMDIGPDRPVGEPSAGHHPAAGEPGTPDHDLVEDGGGFGLERVIDVDASGASGFEMEEDGPAEAHDIVETPEPVADDMGFGTLDGFGALDLQVPEGLEPRASTPAPESPLPSPDDATRPPLHSLDEADDPWTVPGRDPWAPEADETTERPASMESVGFGDEPAPPADSDPHPFDADEEIPDWLQGDAEADGARDEAAPPATFPTREQVRDRYEHDLAKNRDGGASASPRPRPRTGSSPRRGWAMGLVGVAVLGAGGWYLIRGAEAGSDGPPEIQLPAISPTLLPVSREAAARAVRGTVEALRSLPPRDDVPDEPHTDWLAGSYMAGASDYAGVRMYWEAMGRYVQVMRAREGTVFEAQLAAALDTVPLAADDRAEVEARSIAGFAAAAADRDAVYAQLRAVADAALQLHLFLEQNEAQIDYDPAASGLSRDPVLEAVPVTPELGEEMWNRVAGITSALDALGFLDKVTTDQLLEVFFDKLAAVEVR